MDKEIWKDIPQFSGLYEASNYGRIRRTERYIVRNNGNPLFLKERIMKQVKKSNGRMYVNLYKDGKKYCKTVHRLVMSAHVPNPEHLEHINHKDEDPTNNRLDNLEWCTEWYNHHYGTKIERVAQKQCKPINCYDIDGNFIKTYDSIKEASKDLGEDASKITKICKHKWKNSTKYLFEYI